MFFNEVSVANEAMNEAKKIKKELILFKVNF